MTTQVYCIKEFKENLEKLLKKKSYCHLEKLITDYFFNKTIEDLKSGTRLNHSEEAPYIKKRIPDSGGFRFYFLLLMKKNRVYLMYVHPKTGSLGADNLTTESKSILLKKVYHCIKDSELYKLSYNESTNKLIFSEVNLPNGSLEEQFPWEI